MIWSAEWKYSSVFQPPWLKYIQPGQRAVEAACHVSWKWHVHDDVVGDKIEQSRTLRSSYFVDTFLIKTRRFVRPIRMPRGPVVGEGLFVAIIFQKRCGHLALAFWNFMMTVSRYSAQERNCFALHGCALSSRWLVLMMFSGVRDSADLILPIWTWEWNSSWKRPERSSEVRVCLWSECSVVVTDTLTLFRRL